MVGGIAHAQNSDVTTVLSKEESQGSTHNAESDDNGAPNKPEENNLEEKLRQARCTVKQDGVRHIPLLHELYVEVNINGHPISLAIVSGSLFTVLNAEDYRRIGSPRLKRTRARVSSSTSQRCKNHGKCKVSVEYEDRTYPDMELVVADIAVPSVMGIGWLSLIKADWNGIFGTRQSRRPTRDQARREDLNYIQLDEDDVAYNGRNHLELAVNINDSAVPFRISTGSHYTSISRDQWKRIGAPILTKFPLDTYDAGGRNTTSIGCFHIAFRDGANNEVLLPITVENNVKDNIVGLDWIRLLNMNIQRKFAAVNPDFASISKTINNLRKEQLMKILNKVKKLKGVSD